MFTLLWLLLPVAAAGGWFAGRRHARSGEPDDFWGFATNYHQGLNYLLNEQQDKANELFDTASNLDRDTAETHLALGNLFRRRGEVDRAIRLHQSLIDKNQLDESIRSDAMLELAHDFDSAGFLDRSEQQFRELIKRGYHVDGAYESLLLINERARDWARAVQTAEEYAPQTKTKLDSRISHYHCEQAEVAVKEGEVEQALQSLQKALSCSSDSARAYMLLGEIALRQGNYTDAIEHYARVESIRPELTPEIIEPLFEAMDKSGDQVRLRNYISRIQSRFNAYSVIKTTRAAIGALDGSAAADAFLKDQIVKRPSLKGLSDWARGQVGKSPPAERDKVGAMCDMLDRVVKDKPGYVCSECGFSGQSLHWRCPGCGAWDTVHPVIGAEGE